ncbi:hypothetical protein C0583_06515 [Candidatus Parcubacteria bacterium]|nr:MAG: hypothetical protein C0583_06515 [Candidatus Parcubacteria bacterium]
MKNILIINTNTNNDYWLEYFDYLKIKNCQLFFLSSDKKLLASLKKRGYWHKKIFCLFKNKLSFFKKIIFCLLRPLDFLKSFVILSYFKLSKKIDTLILFANSEKISYSRAAKLLALKVYWINSPDAELSNTGFCPKNLSKLSRLAQVIVMLDKQKSKLLEQGYDETNISKINIGIKKNKLAEQKNIFQSIAQNTTQGNYKKFYTVGTIQELSGDVSHIEKLLHSTKNCLDVIPHIQLIIAGEGPERKRLSWMANKMEINNLVWFVGNHRHPQKWLSNFDVFISTTPKPNIKDISILLMAMCNGLCVIAPNNAGLNEIIENNHSGLLADIPEGDDLTSKIINSQQNFQKRKKLGENAKLFANENFRLQDSLEKFYATLEK